MVQHGYLFAIRIVSLLRNCNDNLPELPSELLWIVVNLTSVKVQPMISKMIGNGLVSAVNRFIGDETPHINELALTVLSNLAIDQPEARA